MYTIKQAADKLGIQPSVLRHHRKNGTIHATKVGPIYVISHKELIRFIQDREKRRRFGGFGRPPKKLPSPD